MAAPQHPPPKRSLVKDTGGAIYVEFLVVFIPFFIMVLGMMQIALMYAAHLAVQHSAAAAARAAIVVFPDCEQRYDGAPQNVVNGGGRGDDPASILGSVFGATGGSIPGLGGGGGAGRGGARLDAIRFAASFPMAAASPSLQELLADGNPANQSVLNAIGANSSAAVRLAVGALGYNQIAVAVNFPQQANSVSATLQTRFTRRQSLTTRVTYLFHCGVPIVAAMACDDAPALVSGVPYPPDHPGGPRHGAHGAGDPRPPRRRQLRPRQRLARANWGVLSNEPRQHRRRARARPRPSSSRCAATSR